MNVVALITAICFTAVAVCFFIYLLFSKKPLFCGNLKNFFRAGTIVYISGTLLILLFAIILKGVPTAFIVISELTIMTVFLATFIIIIRLSKTLSKMAPAKAQDNGQEKTDE